MDKDKKILEFFKKEKKEFDDFEKTLKTKKEEIQKAYNRVPLAFAELGSFMMNNAKNPAYDLALYFGAMQLLFMVTPTIRRTAKLEGYDLWTFFSLWQSYVYCHVTKPQLTNLLKLINFKEKKDFKTIDEFNDWLDTQPTSPYAKSHSKDYHSKNDDEKGSVH